MQYRPAFHSLSRGFAPRTPLHALSLAATPARAVRVARSRARSRVWLRPSNSPARSLARRDAGSRRSRGSLAPLARAFGFAPRTPLHALSLAATPARAVRVAPPRRPARGSVRPPPPPPP